MQIHFIGEFETYEWESKVWGETGGPNDQVWNSTKIAENKGTWRGEAGGVGGFYLLLWLWLTMYLFEIPVLKWMSQQSKLRSGICITRKYKLSGLILHQVFHNYN